MVIDSWNIVIHLFIYYPIAKGISERRASENHGSTLNRKIDDTKFYKLIHTIK